MAVASLCLSLGRVVGFVLFVGSGPGAGPNGFELTFHVAGLVVLNVSPVWVSCGWSVRPLLALCCVVLRWRPYRVECAGPLPTSEVKRRRARLVLGWGTAREDLRVLSAFVCDACAAGAQPNFACAPMRCVPPEAACRARLTAHTPRRCARQSVGGTAGVHGDAPARTCAGLVAADGHTASNAPDLF